MKKSPNTPDDSGMRRLAEEKLSSQYPQAADFSETNIDAVRLVHELQVHQIELEMQNDELVFSRSELESTLNMYSELYAFAPVGYFTLMRDGNIRRANLSGAKLLGVMLSQLIKRRFQVFVAPQSRQTFNAFIEKVFLSDHKESCEIVIQKEGPAPFWVLIEGICESASKQGEMCYAIVSDITERKQMEEELRRLSTHDVLTGFYNRGFFLAEMARHEKGRSFPISIIMMEITNLKEMNDREGYAAGDALLKRIAQVLSASFRVEDLIARVGGDEFAVLLPATGAASAKESVLRVNQAVQEHNAAHPETPIRLSIGVSTAETQAPLLGLLKKAGHNMHGVKQTK